MLELCVGSVHECVEGAQVVWVALVLHTEISILHTVYTRTPHQIQCTLQRFSFLQVFV